MRQVLRLSSFLVVVTLLLSAAPASAAPKRSPQYDSLPATSPNGFVLSTGSWPSRTVTYRFLNSTPDLPVPAQQAAIRAALGLWAAMSPLRFVEIAGSADIEFRWSATDVGDGRPFDGVNGSLAEAFYPPPINGNPLAGTVSFDEAETWTDATRTGDSQPIDLMTVAVHEIGHALGIRHSTEPDSVMQASYTGSHRYLGLDDIAAVRAKYALATKWSDYFCLPVETCAVADVDNDGRADLITFIRGSQPEPGTSDVWVALSNGNSFGPATKWHDLFCASREECAVADVNNDGRADLITFIRDAQSEPGRNDVWVALSNGGSFGPATKWHDRFCVAPEQCAVADVNADGRADLVTFIANSQPEPGTNDVWVALSNGTSFGPATKWHDRFCVAPEQCAVADVNGDRRNDLVVFIRSTQSPPGQDDVWVALSNGTSFGPATKWQDRFCVGAERCTVGDVNGDGRADLVTFIGGSQTGTGESDTWVALSSGAAFGLPLKWSDHFCVGAERCRVADVDGDRRADLITFVGDALGSTNANDVWVALS